MKLKQWIEKQPEPVNVVVSYLADRVGVRPPSVRHWIYEVRDVPAGRVLALERATGGEVPRYETRPDLYPPHERAAARGDEPIDEKNTDDRDSDAEEAA